jgi:hypothetical protein
MAKYVIEIPDNQINDYIAPSDDMIFRIPLYKRNGTFSHYVLSDLNLTPYTEPDEQSVKNNNIHLCWSCQNSYPECHAKVEDVLLGDGVGNDNICCCNAYRPTESNASDEDEIRKNAEDEAWELFGVIADMDYDDYEHCFGEDCEDWKVYKLSYQEAKAKYDAWRKQKDEIHEYDEIISEVSDNKAVIVRIDGWGRWHCINADGSFMVEINQQGCWRKTGRSFPELGDVLKKMKEE